MSSIAGIYHLDRGPIDRVLLKRMIDCAPHRSSAAAWIWTDGFVGLAHGNLSATEQSTCEIKTARNELGNWLLTFDGRIDNREELKLKLAPSLGNVTEPTDSELLLSAYATWGTECLKWVIGDYAFALWDGRLRHLYCGRDAYGIRPFYYSFGDNRFVFGSDCLQILQDPKISISVDQNKLAEWFTWCGVLHHSYGNVGATFFQDISALPPAHYLIVNASGIKIKRYWDIDPGAEIRYCRPQEYAEHFLYLFREAVRCRLRSFAPVGAELSGGFDSSSIVCVTAELLRSERNENRRLKTFSLVFNRLSCDERTLINTVTEKYQLESHQLAADELCSLVGFAQSDNSLCDINSPDQLHSLKALQALYQLAYDRGVRVMLSGEGAEQHVLGNSFILDSLVRECRWRELLQRLSVMLGESSYRSVLGGSLKFGVWPVLSGKRGIRYYYRWLHRELNGKQTAEWFTPTFAWRVAGELAQQKERLFGFTRFKDWGKQLVYEGLTPGSSVFCKDISARIPIERRFPYQDRRLIEYCLAIPPEQKFHHLRHIQKRNIRGRALQRNALNGIIPDEILQSHTKVNFNALSKKRMSDLTETYMQVFCPPAVPRVSQIGLIHPGKFWQLVSDFLAGLEKGNEFNSRSYLWINRVAQLEIWLKTLKSIEKNRSSQQTGNHATEDLVA
jgi:asparagine synthase (glutamine-hydrolysing)